MDTVSFSARTAAWREQVAADGDTSTSAIGRAVVDREKRIYIGQNPSDGSRSYVALQRPAVAIDVVLATKVSSAVMASIDAIDPDAPSVLMLTSGSTSLPKAVIQTQRMITSNLAQGCQVLGESARCGAEVLHGLQVHGRAGPLEQELEQAGTRRYAWKQE